MTNDQPSGPDDDLPDAMLEEAVIWLTRLRETAADGTAAAVRDMAFREWLEADPRHRAAFDEARHLWTAVMHPEPVPAPASGARPVAVARIGARAPRLAGLALAASVLLAVLGGAAWKDGMFDRLRADHATATGERQSTILEDGSTLVLGSDTAVDVEFAAGQRRVRLSRGQAWFEVSPDRNRPFVVSTAAGSIRVVGTRFDVRVDGGSAVVSLMEGRVELCCDGPAGQAVALGPGQQARLTAGRIEPSHPFDEVQVGAWRRGQFVFYGTPLSEVVASLNRERPGHILVLGDDLKRLAVSGVFNADNADAVIRAIRETLPVRVRRLTGRLVLLY